MNERPILFSGPMVRALLDGRKTQTRRIMKPQPLDGAPELAVHLARRGLYRWHNDEPNRQWSCKYGVPGDRLWVRESIRYSVEHANHYYAADDKGVGQAIYARLRKKSVPSIFMPRHASRILLAVESVRVERVDDISESDARAEGFAVIAPNARDAFLDLFYGINKRAPRGSNPWVWVIEFRKV